MGQRIPRRLLGTKSQDWDKLTTAVPFKMRLGTEPIDDIKRGLTVHLKELNSFSLVNFSKVVKSIKIKKIYRKTREKVELVFY